MPTIKAKKAGFIQGTSNSSFATARSSNGTAIGGTGGGQEAIAFRYFFSAGRGGGTHSIFRTFLYFDTTGITGVISAQIQINGQSPNNAGSYIIAKATAFGGDGGSALDTADFTEITTTNYTGQISTWSTGTNTITLNSTAVTDITNNDAFIVVFMNNTNDFANTAATSNTTLNNGVNFGSIDFSTGEFTSIKLIYTAASGPANVGFVNKVAAANIGFVNTVAYGSIESINTVS